MKMIFKSKIHYDDTWGNYIKIPKLNIKHLDDGRNYVGEPEYWSAKKKLNRLFPSTHKVIWLTDGQVQSKITNKELYKIIDKGFLVTVEINL